MKQIILFTLLICSGNQISAQIDFSGNASVESVFSGSNNLPFWFYTNKSGRISESTSISAWLNTKGSYKINDNASVEIGGGILLADGLEQTLNIDELYADLSLKWLKVNVGKKQSPLMYNGLSAVNKNILWSLNAQPMPGIELSTNGPIFFSSSKKFGFEASWNEYLMGDQEFVRQTRVHNKSFYLLYNTSNNWNFKAGISHVAQWGGDSIVHGKLPSGFTDYLRIITGRKGGDNALSTDQLNALGNHMGSYQLYIDKTFKDFKVEFIYNSIFEDGSGSRLANFPDGRYGIYLKRENQKEWVTNFLYEFYYTRDQSQALPHLYDNYFNSGVYPSGWTYQKKVIGLPFFTTNYYTDYPKDGSSISIGNNSLIVHHIGISGNFFKEKPYKILVSYRKNYGHFRNRGYNLVDFYPVDDPRGKYTVPKNILSTYMEVQMLDTFVNLKVLLAGDFNEHKSNLGVGLLLSRQF